MFADLERYERLIFDIKNNDPQIKINNIYYFNYYLDIMGRSKININECYDDRLFFDCKIGPIIYDDLDISVGKVSIIHNSAYGFFISFELEILDENITYTYNANDKQTEMFLFNIINDGAIIY